MNGSLNILFDTSEHHEGSVFFRGLTVFLVVCMVFAILGIGGAFVFATANSSYSILMSALLGLWAFGQIMVYALGIYGILRRKRIGFLVMPGIFLFSIQQMLTSQNKSALQFPGFFAIGLIGFLTLLSLISYFRNFHMKTSSPR